jgi:hypothetical protein
MFPDVVCMVVKDSVGGLCLKEAEPEDALLARSCNEEKRAR